VAIELARLAHDRHCQEVVVLDLRGVSPVTDFFVIATGTSDRQMASLALEASDLAAAMWNHPKFSINGLPQATWVLVDCIDVVVHLFEREHRSYYDLEMLWGDTPKVRWTRPAPRHPKKSE